MKSICAAIFAALSLLCTAPMTRAQDVTLRSRDGDVEISGNLMGFDGEFYRVDTIYGELTVDGSGVDCDGPGCPNLDTYIARVTFSGAPTIGRVLMPGLLEAFAIKNDYGVTRESESETLFTYVMSDKVTERVIGEFTFRLTNTDAGFVDLLANEADIVLSLREVRRPEADRAREAGLGNLTAKGRSHVLALDALVPVVSPTNPVEAITTSELEMVLAGEIADWTALGGPDAPISVHILAATSGLGQATVERLVTSAGKTLVAGAVRHETERQLLDAVEADPFAIGVTSRSDTGNAWPLALRGECGFTLSATRQAVKTEDYPLTAPLFLYQPARRFPKLVREFLTYLSEPSAQLVIRRAGFVDQSPEQIPINAQGDRFANAILQGGQETQLTDLQDMVRRLALLERLTTTFRFETGSIQLDAQSRSNVLQLARLMEMGQFDTRRIVFVGFSDGEGPAAKNLEIAQRRADAVKTAVTRAAETANLSRIDIETVAFGEAMPMACDESDWGRQVNRRVEVWVR